MENEVWSTRAGELIARVWLLAMSRHSYLLGDYWSLSDSGRDTCISIRCEVLIDIIECNV